MAALERHGAIERTGDTVEAWPRHRAILWRLPKHTTLAMHRKEYNRGMMTFNDTAGPLMTPRQVAALLQFTTARPIYRMIRRGELPASRIGGRLLIDAGDVETLLGESRTHSRQPTTGLLAIERTLKNYEARCIHSASRT
jgi:excisionase family DNA binding protein